MGNEHRIHACFADRRRWLVEIACGLRRSQAAYVLLLLFCTGLPLFVCEQPAHSSGSGASLSAGSPHLSGAALALAATPSPAPSPLSTPGSGPVSGPVSGQRPAAGEWIEPGWLKGRVVLPGVTALTGGDLSSAQSGLARPELADPYLSWLGGSVLISGTAQYSLRFPTVEDVGRGGPFQVIWNDFYHPDGTPMEGERYFAHCWDMKPVSWPLGPTPAFAGLGAGEANRSATGSGQATAVAGTAAAPKSSAQIVWYGGCMRPRQDGQIARWPNDNFSRDIFAFIEKVPGKWYRLAESVFAKHGTWPRAQGQFRGHRYGSQIVSVPRLKSGKVTPTPMIFYEEVSDVRVNGAPFVTKAFMDEMASPFMAKGEPTELLSPIDPVTRKPYPSALREDGSALVEGPIYFRFRFENEDWEAIGFSAGSFYGKYPAAFASRKVAEGLLGRPFQIDLKDDGSDLHDAGSELGAVLNLLGGPARPAVIVRPDGWALTGAARNTMQVLFHGYRKDLIPDLSIAGFPSPLKLQRMFRMVMHGWLRVQMGVRGVLRFQLEVPKGHKPQWAG